MMKKKKKKKRTKEKICLRTQFISDFILPEFGMHILYA